MFLSLVNFVLFCLFFFERAAFRAVILCFFPDGLKQWFRQLFFLFFLNVMFGLNLGFVLLLNFSFISNLVLICTIAQALVTAGVKELVYIIHV